MRRPIITGRLWLAEFYGEGVKPFFQNLREASSGKHQATSKAASDKHQAPSEDKKSPQASSDKQQAS